jgi:hypothetical protein
MMYVIAAIVVLCAIGFIALVMFGRNLWKPKLSLGSARLIQAKWSHVQAMQDVHRKVMDADAVLDLTLKELGYQGSLGDKLKKAGKYFPDLNAVWRAHKLRNRIAHEPGTQIHPREAQEALQAIESAIAVFLRK